MQLSESVPCPAANVNQERRGTGDLKHWIGEFRRNYLEYQHVDKPSRCYTPALSLHFFFLKMPIHSPGRAGEEA